MDCLCRLGRGQTSLTCHTDPTCQWAFKLTLRTYYNF
jgi:hypothetical protein